VGWDLMIAQAKLYAYN